MKKITKVLISLLIVLMLTGCGKIKTYTSYTIYPIGYLLNRIGGNRIKAISVQTDELVQVAKPKVKT